MNDQRIAQFIRRAANKMRSKIDACEYKEFRIRQYARELLLNFVLRGGFDID